MGYGISDTGSFDEDVTLRVRGTCACDAPLKRDDTLYEPAGTVSLSRLMELAARYADLARCLCGAWTGRSGQSYACYRLPGSGPWLVAAADIAARPRVVALTVRDRLPGDSDHPAVAELPTAELHVAQTLGQPASVRAAWHEALFDLKLGASDRSFPCGAGVRCVATTDARRTGQLDLSTLPEEKLSQWLGEDTLDSLHDNKVICIVIADHSAVFGEIASEAARIGVELSNGARHVAAIRLADAPYTVRLDTGKVLADAVTNGLLLRLYAGFELQRAHRRLRALDSAGQKLLEQLAPLAHHSAADTMLTFVFAHTDLQVDVAAFADADSRGQAEMLTHWTEAAA